MKKIACLAQSSIAVFGLAFFLPPARAIAEDFYQGKTIHFIVGAPAGGGWIVGFFLAIWIIGFVPASAIATFLYLKYGAGEQWPVTAALTLSCWLFFYGFFDYGLQLPFPHGAIFEFVHIHMPSIQNLFAANG